MLINIHLAEKLIMTLAERIYEIVKALPKNQAQEILAFAEFIFAQHSETNQRAKIVNSSVSWTELVYSLAGAWANDFPTLEEIRAESGQDIPRESL
jgi:hypothetical protein